MKNISNIIITHAILLLFFGGAALVLAEETEENTEQTTPQSNNNRRGEFLENTYERQQERESKVAELQTNIEAKRTELQANADGRRAELQTRAQDRIINLSANISNAMDAAVIRLQNIVSRLHSRINKLKALGVDTTQAEASLQSAQDAIDSAINELSNIDEQVAEVVGSEDVKTAWAETKAVYLSVHNHLKTARSELRATVAALKEAIAATELNRGVSDAVRSNSNTGSESGLTETTEAN